MKIFIKKALKTIVFGLVTGSMWVYLINAMIMGGL